MIEALLSFLEHILPAGMLEAIDDDAPLAQWARDQAATEQP